MSAAMRFNLRHLSCFREVACRNSVSASCAHVHLSQPAITQAIAKLESELGANLFVRQSSGMYVTECGKVFLHRIERALAYLEEGTRETLRIAQKSKERGFSNFHRLTTSSQLNALIAVVEAGNFSLAARRTGASQPSIHRRAGDLEKLAGVTLLERTRAGVQPTRAAGTLVRYAKLAFAEIETGVDELKAIDGGNTGRLVIGAMPLARAYILPKALTRFTEEFPDHVVRVIDGPYEQLLAGLRNGDIDVLIGAAREPTPIDDIVQRPIFRDTLAIIVRRGHPLAKRRSISAKALSRYPWIVPHADTPLRQRFNQLFRNVDAPSQIIESGSIVVIRGLLLESERVTMLSPRQVHYELEEGLLQALAPPGGGVGRLIAATVRRDWVPSAPQAFFMSLLKEENFGRPQRTR